MIVATPYGEGSVMAIARAAVRTGQLESFYTTIDTRVLRGLLSPTLKPKPSHRAVSDVPAGLIRTTSAGPEIVYAISKRLPVPRAWSSHLMYRVKQHFDSAVAERLSVKNRDIVVAMYGSASRTFEVAQRTGSFCVLNFVNSHPDVHNALLRRLGGISSEHHHELVPAAIRAAVTRELELAHLVLAPSEFVRDQLLERGVSENRVVTIPYGVDLERFSPRAGRYGSGVGEPLRVLFVGQISHRKGIRILVEAARSLSPREFRFELVGPMVSPEVLRNAPSSLSWRGQQAHKALPGTFRGADVFVLPSLEDAYGLVTLEAMAAGLVVIVSDNCGTRELIENGVNGFVVPAGDAQALRAVLQRLRDDAALCTRLRQSGAATVSGSSWERYGARVMAACESLAATRAR